MRENTADVVTKSSEELANMVTTTAGVMEEVVNRTFIEMLTEATTSPNASTEEEPTTKNTPSVMLLYRIGEALQAAKRTYDSNLTLKQKPPGFVYNEAKVEG